MITVLHFVSYIFLYFPPVLMIFSMLNGGGKFDTNKFYFVEREDYLLVTNHLSYRDPCIRF